MGINFENLLNQHQYEACCSPAKHLRIIAGAGTGKTRVLTYRIAYLISEMEINPNRIVAITFTNKVAKEMQERVEKLMDENGINLGINRPLIATFHGYCYRFLRRESNALDGFNTKFGIAEEDEQKSIFKQVFESMRIDKDKDLQKEIISKIGNLKSDGVFPEDVTEDMLPSFGLAKPSEIIDAYQRYQDRLKQLNKMDFDDLLMFTVRILKEREDIRNRWKRKFDAYLIDEFQDTNLLQYELVQFLLSDRTMLSVVGDPDQTIYTWRGAKSDLIQHALPKDFSDLETVTLDLNYRSTQKILDKANMLIKNNLGRLDKSLVAFNKEEGDDVTYTSCSSDEMEAGLVVNKILDLYRNGAMYKDMVIIYRSNYLSRPFENKLTANKIPYAVYGGMKFFDRMEVKGALAYMRLLVNPQDDFSFIRTLNQPARGVGIVSYQNIKNFAVSKGLGTFEACLENLDDIPLKPAMYSSLKKYFETYKEYAEKLQFAKKEDVKGIIDIYLNKMGFIKYINDLDTREDRKSFDTNDKNTRMKNVLSLMGMLTEFLENDHFDEEGNPIEPSLEEFLIDVALQSAQDEVDDANKVLLMTAHVSKGLEFPCVFVVGLDQRIFPTSHAEEKGLMAIEEERRLCYVAVTRAKTKLFISSQGGFSYIYQGYNMPSQFIEEMGFKKINTQSIYRDESINNKWSGGYSNKSKGRYEYDGVFKQQKKPTRQPLKPVIVQAPVAATPNFSQTKLESEMYSIGDKIAHVSFGKGEVIEVTTKEIIVKFDEPFGVKKLMKGFKAFRKVA